MNDIIREKIGYRNEEYLHNQYWNLKKSPKKIAEELNCSKSCIRYWMIKFDIPRRSKSEAQIGCLSSMKGKKHTEKTKRKMSEAHKNNPKIMGENNPKWKGDNISYIGIHQFIRRYKPKPEYCTICNKYSKKLDCCSIDHIYTRNPEDYIWLCRSCHRLFDKIRVKNKEERNFIFFFSCFY